MNERFGNIRALGGLFVSIESIVAIFVFLVVLILFVPIPPVLIDLFLSISITFSVLILLVSFYLLRPLDFSVFPTLLLIVTLFRLSLSVAATRLILLFGNTGPGAAGEVIRAFGQFVVGGNYLTGFIIFLILVTINFVVITKGAQRIAEVAARFILDAMPGKQMSIDADLNAGLITENEARNRRDEISREADFYGAMDGASKFIRGDAIASLIIIAIAILGGLGVGIFMQGLDVGTALRTYTLLSVGEGLVAQIPALLVSVGAGVVITRSATKGEFAKQIITQVFTDPKVVGTVSLVIFLLALIPGLPKLPFFTIAIAMGLLAYMQFNRSKVKQAVVPEENKREEETTESMLAFDILSVEVGLDLIPLVDASQGGQLLPRIRAMRREIAKDLGIIIPPIHIKDNLTLNTKGYCVLLHEAEIGSGEIWPSFLLVMNPKGGTIEVEGLETKDPAFGLNAKWIRPELKDRAREVGLTAVEPEVVLVTHLSELVRQHAHEILDVDQVQTLLNNLRSLFPKLIDELIPNVMTIKQLELILKNLLKEMVSIKNLHSILETLSEHAPETKDIPKLTETARQAMGRQIVSRLMGKDRTLHVITLDPEFDDYLTQHIRNMEKGEYLALDPHLAREFIQVIDKKIEIFAQLLKEPALMTSTVVRLHVKKLVERFIKRLHVLSYNEIPPDIQLKIVGQVKVEAHASEA